MSDVLTSISTLALTSAKLYKSYYNDKKNENIIIIIIIVIFS